MDMDRTDWIPMLEVVTPTGPTLADLWLAHYRDGMPVASELEGTLMPRAWVERVTH